MNELKTLSVEPVRLIISPIPYRNGERGTNENTNGLLRQLFLKGSDFTGTTKQQVDLPVHLLNSRPCKQLNAEPPEQRLRKLSVAI